MIEYERALSLEPTNALAHANVVYLSRKHCQWRSLQQRHHRLVSLLLELLGSVEARRQAPMRPAPHLFLPPYHALAYEHMRPHWLRQLATAYAEHAAERSGAVAAAPALHPPAHSAYWGLEGKVGGVRGGGGWFEGLTHTRWAATLPSRSCKACLLRVPSPPPSPPPHPTTLTEPAECSHLCVR